MALSPLPNAGVLKGTSALYQVYRNATSYEYVSFSNVLTESINVKPLMDGFKADQIGTSVEIRFTAIASYFVVDSSPSRTGANSLGTPEFGSLTDADDIRTKTAGVNTKTGNLEFVLRLLSSNRGRFVYKIGNSVLYDVAPKLSAAGFRNGGWGGEAGVGVAVNQTPIVEASVNKVLSDSTAHVSVTVKFDYVRCTNEDAVGGRANTERYYYNVKSLRWYFADDIDTRNWMTKRHYRGRLELYDRDINAHVLRQLVFPPLQLGFKRESISLNESEDGMSLDFEVVDQETYGIPPHPISSWQGGTNISFPRLLIGKANVSTQLEVEAPPSVSKRLLAAWALRIVDAKIHWYNSVSSDRSVFTERFDIADSFTNNKISINVGLSFILPKSGFPTSPSYEAPSSGIFSTVDTVLNNDLSYDENRKLSLTEKSDPEQAGPGHLGGIPYYQPWYSRQWYPSNHTVFGIVYCALQNPCSGSLQRPYWYVDKPADPNESPAGDSYNNQEASGGSGQQDPESGESIPALQLDDQEKTYPYTKYEIQTIMSTDMGIRTFSPMHAIKTLTGEKANRIIHQSNAPTETVTLMLDAKRLNRWPNGPNELSFKDEVTGIYYICQSVDIIANTAVNDALRQTVEYSLRAVVKYQLSRNHRFNEDKRVFTPPFITEAVQDDENLGNSLRHYYQSEYSKSGFHFKPGGDEDVGATEPPAGDGDDPITPIV
jgi:hypothetical protein